MSSKSLTPMSKDSAQWYIEVVKRADLADYSPVKGCMIIKPYGYAIWEMIQKDLDKRIKDAGVQNAYFPLFIPKSFLSREAEHVKGFAKECAIVTHYRLRETVDGKGVEVDPESKLEEELIVRPTSETIMYDTFSKWIESWRDLPLKINQWANIVRWEMRTRPFLRTLEFLWQEGHTAHATREEAEAEVNRALKMYRNFAKDTLAIPLIMGKKTKGESFPGADYTTTIEALLRDGKALQCGTSHLLGQNFAKSFNIKFVDKDNKEQYVWQTSWGMTTRMIGALILMHGDDIGLVLPPNVAPIQIVIVPIFRSDEEKILVQQFVEKVSLLLGNDFRIEIDWRDESPGWKFSEWEMKGVPLRFEIGPRDVSNNSVFAADRRSGKKMAIVVDDNLADSVKSLLTQIQNEIYDSANEYVNSHLKQIESYDEFISVAKDHEGLISTYFCGDKEEEDLIKYETKFGTRCMPFEHVGKFGKCLKCGKEDSPLTYFGKAY